MSQLTPPAYPSLLVSAGKERQFWVTVFNLAYGCWPTLRSLRTLKETWDKK